MTGNARVWVPGGVPQSVAVYLRKVLTTAIEAGKRDAIWPLLSMLYGLGEEEPPAFLDALSSYLAEPANAVRRIMDWARRQATPQGDSSPLSVVSPDAVRVAEWLGARVRRRAEYDAIYADDIETLLVLAHSADLAEAAARARARRPKELQLPVLLLGESGTGKELLAKALHRIHMRTYAELRGEKVAPDETFDAHFGPINCAGLPPQLIEAELYGHERHAFTDAKDKRAGLIMRCKDGTLFLDEVGDTPLDVQLRLLRFLNDGEVRSVGKDHPDYAYPWVIAATHRDLASAVAEGKFREDMFNRLNGHVLHLKPLRQRGDDALGALDACITRHAGRALAIELTIPAERALRGFLWPANLRAVDQLARRIVQERDVRGEHLFLDVGDLPLDIQKTYFDSHPYSELLVGQYAEEVRTLDADERAAMRASLARHFAEVAPNVVPEVKFCRTVAKLAATTAVRNLFDDAKEHEALVRAVEALSARTERQHVATFRAALHAVDGLDAPEEETGVEVVATAPWLRKILAVIEAFAGNPAASAPLRNLEAWLEKLPAPARAVVMDILAEIAEAARTAEWDEDVIEVRDVDAVDWKALKKDKAAFEERLRKAGSIAALARELNRDPKTVSKAADDLGVPRSGARKKAR